MSAAHRHTPSGAPRARGLGIVLPGTPGPLNAITDVTGVEVGYCTLVAGAGALKVGHGPVRTGVTAILPRGRGHVHIPVFGGMFSLNGNGEMTGCHWLRESGQLEGPIALTGTQSVGVARDAIVQWLYRIHPGLVQGWGLPVAAETWDGDLSDAFGGHVRSEHVFAALDAARGGPLELGSVGGGTGMICYDYKGGSGSASRIADTAGGPFAVGAFVQSNFGRREELTIAGVPVGRHLRGNEIRSRPGGSIIGIIATTAPLLPHQLERLARRAALGVARSGTVSHDGSGDLFLAFSTANAEASKVAGAALRRAEFLPGATMDPLFTAVVECTDEAIIDSMIANRSMTGRDDITVDALPHAHLLDLLARYGRPAIDPDSVHG